MQVGRPRHSRLRRLRTERALPCVRTVHGPAELCVCMILRHCMFDRHRARRRHRGAGASPARNIRCIASHRVVQHFVACAPAPSLYSAELVHGALPSSALRVALLSLVSYHVHTTCALVLSPRCTTYAHAEAGHAGCQGMQCRPRGGAWPAASVASSERASCRDAGPRARLKPIHSLPLSRTKLSARVSSLQMRVGCGGSAIAFSTFAAPRTMGLGTMATMA